MASTATSSAFIDFIDNHQFIDLTIGNQHYDSSIEEECNVNDLQGIVKNILWGVLPLVDTSYKEDSHDVSQTIIPSKISHVIYEISCQMTCKAERGKRGEALKERLRGIFFSLSSYRWTTEVLLVLAAFALQYGDFWYISKVPSERGNALLNGLSSLKKKLISDKKAKKVVPFNKVVIDLLDWTNSLVSLEKLETQHLWKHVPKLAEAFRTMSKWSCEAIIAILATGDYFGWLMDDDKSAEPLELGILASSVSDKKKPVLKMLEDCKKDIARMKEYQEYVKNVEAPANIMDCLRSLLTVKDPLQDPFVTEEQPVSFEFFRKKSVLLVISDPERSSTKDIDTLQIIYDDRTPHQRSPQEDESKDVNIPIGTEENLYELVWIPMVGRRLKDGEAIPNFKSPMPGYRVDPQKMNELARMYIKEEWHFKRETIVVVLDSRGWVENTDAMPMLRIWGTKAFPYTGNESTHPWMSPWNWVELILGKPGVHNGTSAMDEYILFGEPSDVEEVAADARGGVPRIGRISIKNSRHFRTLLRSCLICRLQAVRILKKSNVLSDRIVFEMSEAYKACQRGGVAILTTGHDLQVKYVGFLSDIKLALRQDPEAWPTALAKGFDEKYDDTQGQYKDLHACVPHYTDLEDLYCPGCGRFMRYDLCLMCCHSDSD